MIRKDRLFAICLVLVSVVCFIFTLDFPKEAAYYPRAIIFLMISLSIILFIKAKPEDTVDIKAVFVEFFTHRKLLYVLISLVLMIALMKILGLYVELPIFVFCMLKLLGYSNTKNSVIISISLTVIIYLLFSVLLRVRIPMGILKGIL